MAWLERPFVLQMLTRVAYIQYAPDPEAALSDELAAGDWLSEDDGEEGLMDDVSSRLHATARDHDQFDLDHDAVLPDEPAEGNVHLGLWSIEEEEEGLVDDASYMCASVGDCA